MTNDELYSMELHDEIHIIDSLYVLRVPGGWLYQVYTEQESGHFAISVTFVSLNNEFQSGLRKE